MTESGGPRPREPEIAGTAGSATPVGRHVVVGGVRCHYLEAGSGEALVLLHGTAIDSAGLSFGPSIPHLARSHRVLALDWPGYGSSERPLVDMTVEHYVSLLEGFLAAVGVGSAHLAGFSMGGAVATGFTLRAPDKVSSLTLIASHGLDDAIAVPLIPYLAVRAPRFAQSVVWGLRRSRLLTRLVLTNLVFSNARLVTAELVAEVHDQLRAPEAERSFVAWLRGELLPFNLGTTYEDRLGAIEVPTLLMHGRNDRVVSWRKSVRASKRLSDAKLALLPRCGHWVMREAPAEFRRELSAFTERHSAS